MRRRRGKESPIGALVYYSLVPIIYIGIKVLVEFPIWLITKIIKKGK